MTERFAIYFAPKEDSIFHELGSAWLGRDAHTQTARQQPAIDGLPDMTAEPRRYGFHATLKAPFRLKSGVAKADLLTTATRFASRRAPFDIVRLEVRSIAGFLALMPILQSAEIQRLADACVVEFDSLRDPMSGDEIEKRRSQFLTGRQDRFLVQWGYPFVFEDFRFHMTLTGKLADADLERLLPLARAHFATLLEQPVPVDGITIFREPAPGEPFHILERLPLVGAREFAAA